MPYADLEDINQHLPFSQLQITEQEDEPWQVDAERIIRGYLSNVFTSATLSSWTTPSNTPDIIRSIAGRFIAAWFYASKVAGELGEWPDYSDHKYKEALKWLEDVQTGQLVLDDLLEPAVFEESLTSEDFWPNDDAAVFTIAKEFA